MSTSSPRGAEVGDPVRVIEVVPLVSPVPDDAPFEIPVPDPEPEFEPVEQRAGGRR